MKHRKTQTCAGLALLAALLWAWPLQLPGQTATTQAGAATAKTPADTAKKKRRSTSQQASRKASPAHKASTANASQSRSTHRPAKRHLTKAQIAAAERRRRARMRPSPERIEEIQQALVQAGYLNAQPNGRWDDPTREAMRRYQTDHGFPVTGLPEAKSLMKLGLGPHPLPPDLDTSSTTTSGATAASQPSPASEAQQNPPSSTPQP